MVESSGLSERQMTAMNAVVGGTAGLVLGAAFMAARYRFW
jgi:hypothetical protein